MRNSTQFPLNVYSGRTRARGSRIAHSSATTHEYKNILDNLTAAVLVLSGDLTVRYLNPAAENLFETSLIRSAGLAFGDILLDSEDALETLRTAARTGQPYTRRETEFLLASGAHKTVDYSVSLFDQSPAALLVEIQPRDRLLRISREEDLISQQQTTQILVRGMAHEIKNPLGGIRGAAQLLDRELSSASQREYTHVIIAEADRLRGLVDRMLGPNQALKLTTVNIHEVLEHVRTLLEAESRGRVLFHQDYDPSLPELSGDKEQLIQALLNIARNAMEAAFESQPPSPNLQSTPTISFRTRALRQVTIGSKRHRLACRIDIIDNGPGISPELRQKIFYPMISGRANGSGLGLSITQGIIGQHQGLVECESAPGQTDFIILLPLESSP